MKFRGCSWGSFLMKFTQRDPNGSSIENHTGRKEILTHVLVRKSVTAACPTKILKVQLLLTIKFNIHAREHCQDPHLPCMIFYGGPSIGIFPLFACVCGFCVCVCVLRLGEEKGNEAYLFMAHCMSSSRHLMQQKILVVDSVKLRWCACDPC